MNGVRSKSSKSNQNTVFPNYPRVSDLYDYLTYEQTFSIYYSIIMFVYETHPPDNDRKK